MTQREWSGDDRGSQAVPFAERIAGVAREAGSSSVEQLQTRLAAIRVEFLPHFDSAEEAGLINDLDDLALFLDQPTTLLMREKYFRIRLGTGADNREDADYAVAVDCLTSVLANESKRDLHLDAALELADLYLRLLRGSERAGVVATIRGSDRGMLDFERFVTARTCGSRLRPMLPFARERK